MNAAYRYIEAEEHIMSLRYAKALNCLHRAIHLIPTTALFYVQRGEIYLHLCDFSSAILNYKVKGSIGVQVVVEVKDSSCGSSWRSNRVMKGISVYTTVELRSLVGENRSTR